MTQERRDELYDYCWHYETNDEETHSWRDDLTSEEQELVDKWDRQYIIGMGKLVKEILALERQGKRSGTI